VEFRLKFLLTPERRTAASAQQNNFVNDLQLIAAAKLPVAGCAIRGVLVGRHPAHFSPPQGFCNLWHWTH
jgi:hypothetical protein